MTVASTRNVYEPDQVRHQHYAFEERKNDLASAIPVHGVLHFILVNLLLIIPIVVTVIIAQKIHVHQLFYMGVVKNCVRNQTEDPVVKLINHKILGSQNVHALSSNFHATFDIPLKEPSWLLTSELLSLEPTANSHTAPFSIDGL